MAYTTQCRDLAEEWLNEADYPNITKEQVNRLAQTIQDTIEEFLGDLELDRLQELEAAKDEADDRRGKERDEWRHEAAEWQRLK